VLGRCTTSDPVSLLCIFQTKLLSLRHFSCPAYVRQVIWWDFVACMNGWIHECRERFCVVRSEYVTIVCSDTSKIRCVTRGFTFHYIKPWNQDTLASIEETRPRKSKVTMINRFFFQKKHMAYRMGYFLQARLRTKVGPKPLSFPTRNLCCIRHYFWLDYYAVVTCMNGWLCASI
jgi:hypothetical protein